MCARERVVIIGGGTAGWMTAAYLKRALPSLASVTVVESASIGTIGVGEASFSTLKLYFDFLGLDESEWMPASSATYKFGIRFVNWTRNGGHFYHPFQRLENVCGHSTAEWWLKLRQHAPAFDYACFTVPWLCDAMRSPRFMDGTIYDEKVREFFPTHSGSSSQIPNTLINDHEVQYPYGYHFNATELAVFLSAYAMRSGVNRVIDDVVGVLRSDSGGIRAIQTNNHGLIEGDLFVDCSGFRRLLIEQALGEPFVSYADTLLTDRAIAIQVPREVEKDGIKPYTTAHALTAGWSWNIPLYGRDGTGYVYSSHFVTEEQAEREFRQFLGCAAEGRKALHVKMQIGRCRNTWVHNCVAIGLAAGFVEPLESTGLFFIQHAIEELVNHFPIASTIEEQMVAGYNQIVRDCFDGVRDFLTIHYLASDRLDTPFWAATKEVTPPESLRERLQIWTVRLPGARNIYQPFHGFEPYSWAVMLLGLNYRPASHLRVLDTLDESQAQAMLRATQERAAHLVRTLPTHFEYLRTLRSTTPATL